MIATDRQALLTHAARCQADALGLLADEATDRGDHALEAGYRWLASHGKWPNWSGRGGDVLAWFWDRPPQSSEPSPSWPTTSHTLPDAKAWDRYLELCRVAAWPVTFGKILEIGARAAGEWMLRDGESVA